MNIISKFINFLRGIYCSNNRVTYYTIELPKYGLCTIKYVNYMKNENDMPFYEVLTEDSQYLCSLPSDTSFDDLNEVKQNILEQLS